MLGGQTPILEPMCSGFTVLIREGRTECRRTSCRSTECESLDAPSGGDIILGELGIEAVQNQPFQNQAPV